MSRDESICIYTNGKNDDICSNCNLKPYLYLTIFAYRAFNEYSHPTGAFLAAADSKKFAIFNVKTGKYLGEIRIPAHLERSKGKEEKYCMFEQTGLRLVIKSN